MPIAVYTSEDFHAVYLAKRVDEAKKTLDRFPVLRELMGDLEEFKNSEQKEIRNTIVVLCARATAGMFGVPQKDCEQLLAKIEKALDVFDARHWETKKLNYLVSRIKSNDPVQNAPVVDELLIGLHYVDKLGKQNVEVGPEIPRGRHPDLRITINGRSIFLEITRVSMGLAEEKLERIFENVAKHVWTKLQESKLISMAIDCARIETDDKGRIDIAKSTEEIIRFIDRLNLVPIFERIRHINLETLSQGLRKDKTLYESKDILRYSNEELYREIEKEPVKSFAKSTKVQELENSPISMVISGLAKAPLVQVSATGFFPSKSALDEQKAFLKHIIRSIDGKINGDQFEHNSPNIIVIEASNWTFFGYSSDPEIADLNFKPIHDRIQEYLIKNTIPYLSGILVFENVFSSGRFLPNPNVDWRFELSQKEVDLLFC